MRKKKRKMGRVMLEQGYVVDLNDPEMVMKARDLLYEDLCHAKKYNELYSWIETVEDPSLSPEDISESLLYPNVKNP